MALNAFESYTLDPNTSGTTAIQIDSTTEVTLGTVTIDTTGSTDVKLDATVGMHIATDAAEVILRIRDNTSSPVVRAKVADANAATDDFTVANMVGVDDATGESVTYDLTAALSPSSATAGDRVRVIGPITLTAAAIG
ncbi:MULTISPECIES: hypothetical protein [unclassified Candidatus Frackibacter]|uniref:hypothetical protein n=1 Tax=unclassified Candidatus Frackibacter TaxID=2648818 RepID=UPI0008813AC5|nr:MULTISPECIES: hypothetical protein [unclassified Candidatus Frackibacter]SDC82705.1 hypothetical protein SAMN04515661_12812 [Candidatus Frackibacter sp. WG11]SEM97176.1 hypothetical protein SAMN04488698_13012 [Candidatus Frackibacter sp. WG12]SFM05828.1 hypothetical protein SAMN04488699_13012 [Candidatus Frackibacter sp. WG13]